MVTCTTCVNRKARNLNCQSASAVQRTHTMRQGRPSKPSRPFSGRRDQARPARDPAGPAILYGHHSVVEALKNPKREFRRLLATENALKRLQDEGVRVPSMVEVVRPGAIDRELTPDAVHQGLLLEADPLVAPELESLPDNALVLVLDQITDPHNVGAIVRTAAAFDVAAIVTTARHSPEATGVLAKSASGGLEHVPIIAVRNLSDALDTLASRNFQRIGLDSEGDSPLPSIPMRRPLALVLGAEGKGLRQKTRTFCDSLARLDMPGAIKSLNVSNATAIALHVAVSSTNS
jgi:23S rRNA (guanosine2251-2'-O)-methyltransferase